MGDEARGCGVRNQGIHTGRTTTVPDATRSNDLIGMLIRPDRNVDQT